MPQESPDERASQRGRTASTDPPRVKGTPLTDEERAEIIRRHRAGEGDRRIARALGIHKMTVYNVKKDAGLLMTRPVHGPPVRSEPSSRPSPSGTPGGGKRMTEGEESQAVRLAMLERDNRELNDRIKGLTGAVESAVAGIRKATAQPPTFEPHEDQAQIGCPQCGTSRTIKLPPNGGPQTFDDVLGLLDAPLTHAGGKTFKDCPDCKPKADAKFASLGYFPKPPAED